MPAENYPKTSFLIVTGSTVPAVHATSHRTRERDEPAANENNKHNGKRQRRDGDRIRFVEDRRAGRIVSANRLLILARNENEQRDDGKRRWEHLEREELREHWY